MLSAGIEERMQKTNMMRWSIDIILERMITDHILIVNLLMVSLLVYNRRKERLTKMDQRFTKVNNPINIYL